MYFEEEPTRKHTGGAEKDVHVRKLLDDYKAENNVEEVGLLLVQPLSVMQAVQAAYCKSITHVAYAPVKHVAAKQCGLSCCV